MRKIIFLMHVSLDGYVAGPNGEMDFILYDEELEKYSHDLHEQTDTAIYGRVTYEMMQGYWLTVFDNPESTEGDLNHGKWYRDATKIVISGSMQSSDQPNTIIIGDNIAEKINRMKQEAGKDMWLLGSPSAAQTFMELDLIDEYRLNVNPVLLGGGKPLYGVLDARLPLKLIEARAFKSGVVGLRYERT